DQVGLLVSLELCSLTLQHGDDSTANLISSGLFGDGAAAVVMAGAAFEGPVHGGSVHGGAARGGAATIADPAAGAAADAAPDLTSAATRDAAPDPEADPEPEPAADTVDATRAHNLHITASASHLYPGTEDQLGWHIGANGFAIMLAAGLPRLIEEHLAHHLDAF